MAERKATNKYYPPDWTPNQGSLNTYHGSHPLRERARKIKQGIMIVRFELPFNIWCGGCGSHVGMGVRYNAEKTTVGQYYSTRIFKFRMKCHLCDNHFEITTDPQNCDYVVTSGASRKNERWEHTEGETVSVEGHSDKERMASDPMFKLEHSVQDEEKVTEETPRLDLLQNLQDEKKDDFAINQLLRKRFREEKKHLEEEEEQDRQLQKKASISIPLVPENDKDIVAAKKMHYSHQDPSQIRKMKRRDIKTQSLFGKKRGKLEMAKLRMDSKIFSGIGSNSLGSSSGVKQLRTKLGIQTKK